MARRTPYWAGPGGVTTESAPLVVPDPVSYSFVGTVADWVDNFNGQYIAAGQSFEAEITASWAEHTYKLKAVS